MQPGDSKVGRHRTGSPLQQCPAATRSGSTTLGNLCAEMRQMMQPEGSATADGTARDLGRQWKQQQSAFAEFWSAGTNGIWTKNWEYSVCILAFLKFDWHVLFLVESVDTRRGHGNSPQVRLFYPNLPNSHLSIACDAARNGNFSSQLSAEVHHLVDELDERWNFLGFWRNNWEYDGIWQILEEMSDYQPHNASDQLLWGDDFVIPFDVHRTRFLQDELCGTIAERKISVWEHVLSQSSIQHFKEIHHGCSPIMSKLFHEQLRRKRQRLIKCH